MPISSDHIVNELFPVLLSTFCGWRCDDDKDTDRENDGANVHCYLDTVS